MSKLTRVMILDDEPGIRKFLRHSLDPERFEVIEAENGATGLRLVATKSPAVVLLDLGLPDMDGVEVARQIREWSEVPIIVLSAREHEQDKIAALDAGADDYLTKPFSVGELEARIRAALRRGTKVEAQPLFRSGDVEVDLQGHVVRKGGAIVHLTPNEFKLLACLIKHAGRVVTHKQLLTEVWGPSFADEPHYLRVYMGQLRQKLEDEPARPSLLATESGVGYRLISE